MRTAAHIAAFLLAGALALYPMTLVNDIYPLALLAGLAFAAFILALLSVEWVLAGPGMGILMIEYAVALSMNGAAVDRFIPVAAVAAFLLLEIIDLVSVLARTPVPEREVVANHVRHIVLTAAVGGSVTAAMLLAAEIVTGGPAPLAGVAAACGLGAMIITVVLTRRAVHED
jgi:hypothetical protein